MNKLIFSVNEDSLDIVQVTKFSNTISINKVLPLKLSNVEGENIVTVKNLLSTSKIKTKKVDVIFSLESILTRIIETPSLSKNDLQKYITNNINEYFTVNIDEFCYDYKIIERKGIHKKKLFSVLLVAMPKLNLKTISTLLSQCNLIIDNIDIYPNCMSETFSHMDKSIAILDANEQKSNFTIINKGEIFVYSILTSDFSNEDGYSDIAENINYFLNFYSTRHFGNKIQAFYLLGTHSKDELLKKYIRETVDVKKITYIKDLKLSIKYKNNIMPNTHLEILGRINRRKSIYNKHINLKLLNRKNLKAPGKLAFVITPLLLISLTIGFISYNLMKISTEKSKYTTTNLDKEIVNLKNLETELANLNKEKALYDNKLKLIEEINNDNFDYMKILNSFKDSLPSTVTIKTITLDKSTINLTLNINSSTLDVAKSVIAINNMKLFEHFEASDVALNDTVTSATFQLQLLNSKVGDTNGQ